MRISVDATPLLGQPTGVGAFVAGALGALPSVPGLDLSAYALSARGARHLPGAVPASVGVVSAPLPAGLLLALWSRTGRPSLDRILGRPDVVHGTNFVVPPTRGGAVVTVHDLTPVRFPDLASARTRMFPALIRRAVDAGAFVHTPSAFVAGEVVELLGVPADRVRAVHHGVPPVAVGEGRSTVDGPYVLALGTVEPRKNLVALVHAFDDVADDLTDLRLVIAGADGWGVHAVDDAIVRARHTRRIVRIGYVADADRWGLLVNATVFAYPSVYEGFGLPPLEAMAAGVPVVASTAGALPEVLGDAALLVGPDALAGALVTAVTDQAERDRLVAAGHQQVARYSWDRCAAGLADIYRGAAG